MPRHLSLVLALIALGCSDDVKRPDARLPPPDSSSRDSGSVDTMAVDARPADGLAHDQLMDVIDGAGQSDGALDGARPDMAEAGMDQSIDRRPLAIDGSVSPVDISADFFAGSDAGGCSPACTGDRVCLGQACSCIKALHGNSYLRTDGTVVNYSAVNLQRVISTGAGQPLDRITAIFDGQFHGCGLRDDGTVWCWAKLANGNNVGQLGNGVVGGVVTRWQATQVMRAPATSGGQPVALTDVERINGGSSRCYLASSMCAVLKNGTLWCWGSPDSSGGGGGSLFNDGVAGNRPLAVQILASVATPLTGVSQVSLGTRHACVLRSGEVWCWGANVAGPLGQGDQTARVYPTKVALAGAAQQVGAGADVTCARVGDAVYCWGANNSGQIGIGSPSTTTDGCINFCKRTPARVLSSGGGPLAGVVDLQVAYLGVCARLVDHTLWCWGRDIGDTARPLALPIVGGTRVVDNVAHHTTCTATPPTKSIRYLTRANELRNNVGVVNQQCP